MVSVDSSLDPLLKRPLSIHRWLGGDIQLLYRVIGKGTKILSMKKRGHALDIIGPLGNGFPTGRKKGTIILVAGGLGIAPIFALADSLVNAKKTKAPSPEGRAQNVLLFYGARTKEEVLCAGELASIGIDPVLSTDDGSSGKKGTIVRVLERYVSRPAVNVTDLLLFACGPEPMLHALSRVAKKHSLRGYVALEEKMACGLGTCLGCVVMTTKGYKRVCKEGPVFPIEDIVWEKK